VGSSSTAEVPSDAMAAPESSTVETVGGRRESRKVAHNLLNKILRHRPHPIRTSAQSPLGATPGGLARFGILEHGNRSVGFARRAVQIPRLAALARDDALRGHPERSRGICTSHVRRVCIKNGGLERMTGIGRMHEQKTLEERHERLDPANP